MKKSKKKIILNLMIIICITNFIGCTSKLDKIESYLNNEDYSKAMKKIYLLKDENEKQKADEMLENKINDIENKFINKEIDGTLAISNIQKLKSDNISADADKTIDEITTLMNSRKAFKNAARNEEEEQYGEALALYDEVSSYDSENYQKSREKVDELKNYLQDNEILSIVSSKVIIISNTHKSLYPDQIQVILKNNGDKVIRKFEVVISAYDKDGNPTKIQGANSSEKSDMFLGTGENITINPGMTWGNEYGWSLNENHNISSLSACIKNVEFSDDTTWENPLYKYWLKNHWSES